MKIAVVGAGAIGGYLGVRLALSGQQVTFIARNQNLAAIRARGFKLIDEDGRVQHATDVRAVQDMADAGPQDVVLLALKAHQVRGVLPALLDLFGPETILVTMINGVPWWYFHRLAGPYEGRCLSSVDPDGAIARYIDPERVIGSVVYPAAEVVEPGVVRLIEGNRFTLGEPTGDRSRRVEALSQVMTLAGFKAPVSKDIRTEIWTKLWGNLSFNPISALTHATLGGICRHPLARELVVDMMREAQAVAEQLGVVFKISLDQRIAGAAVVGAHKTSMLRDVERGRALELEALVGSVVELGRITGTPTPSINAIYAATALLAQTLTESNGRLEVQPLR
ncbi:MAG: 2-dehydropantoate 2-reductase [Burkholderiaceae bacterium]|nr:2-dehydropantoate 2-reductase [Burkholderiaceae bacterium]